jgi:hypothetical protein
MKGDHSVMVGAISSSASSSKRSAPVVSVFTSTDCFGPAVRVSPLIRSFVPSTAAQTWTCSPDLGTLFMSKRLIAI